MIAASNSLIVGFDNLSGLPNWLSDAICCLATGGGFSTRSLYTDDEEKIFDAMRPVLLNGIDNVAGRSDLLDRAVPLHLRTISEKERKSEADLWTAFEAIRPRVLGALLDGVVDALEKKDSVRLESYPRMADFAIWATAAEDGLGWAPGTFMAAYTTNRQEAHELAVETSPIGAAVLGFMSERAEWHGSAKELRANLENNHADEKTKKRQDWPKTPEAMGIALKRIAPNLRAIGLGVEFLPRQGQIRPIHLSWLPERRPAKRDGSSPARDGSPAPDCHEKTGLGDTESVVCDGRDGDDGAAPTHSPAGVEDIGEWSA